MSPEAEPLDHPTSVGERITLGEAAHRMGCTEEHVEKLILDGKIRMERTSTGTPMVLTPLPRYRRPWRGRFFRPDRAPFEYQRHVRFAYLLSLASVFAALIFVPGFRWGGADYWAVRWLLLAAFAVVSLLVRFLAGTPKE